MRAFSMISKHARKSLKFFVSFTKTKTYLSMQIYNKILNSNGIRRAFLNLTSYKKDDKSFNEI